MDIRTDTIYAFNAKTEAEEFWDALKWARERGIKVRVAKNETHYGIKFSHVYNNEDAKDAVKWFRA